MSSSQPVSLALGGGGAKGFAHIGVIAALVERGYRIATIVGTSIGAIVGSVFAYNAAVRYRADPNAQQKAVEALTDVFLETNFISLLDMNWRSLIRGGPIRGKKVVEWLDDQFLETGKGESIRFYDLAFDLQITATNYSNGAPILFSASKSPATFVSAAVRASMSIQGVFPPAVLDYNGQQVHCWDGGTTGNCRFDLAYKAAPECLTVGSSLTYRGEPADVRTGFFRGFLRPLHVANRSADIWLRQIENVTEELLGDAMKTIVIVRPDLAGVDTMSFHVAAGKRKLLIENGRVATCALLDQREKAS